MKIYQPERKTIFVTFYSFKGGVGRTMALVNAACILAGRGRRVLMIDFDLEAPGLTMLALKQLVSPEQTCPAGLVDLILDALTAPANSVLADKEHPARYAEEYVCSLNIPEHLIRMEGGKLDLMPCGRLDGSYEERLYSIDFAELYAEGIGQPLFKHLKNLIRDSKLYDYILIDSRTGFSDEGGISTRDLADHIVVLTGLNRQNIDGTVRFLTRLKASGWKEGEVLFILSPVPTSYEELRAERTEYAKKEIEKTGFKADFDLYILYHPRLALDEEPFVYNWTETDLFRAYESVCEMLQELAEDTPFLWADRGVKAVQDGQYDEGMRYLRLAKVDDDSTALQALTFITGTLMDSMPEFRQNAEAFFDLLFEIRPEDSSAWLRYGQMLCDEGEYYKAMNAFNRSLEIARAEGTEKDVIISHRNIGYIHQLRGDYDAARNEHEIALKNAEQRNDKEGIIYLRIYIADIYEDEDDYDTAIREYELVLNLYEELEDCSSAAVTRSWIAHLHQKSENYESAKRIYEDLLKMPEQLGSRNDSLTRKRFGILKILMGDIADGRKMIENAITSLKAMNALDDVTRANVDYARSLLQIDELQAALEHLNENWGNIQRYADADDRAEAHVLRGQIRLKLNDATGAVEDAEAALKFYRAQKVHTQSAKDAEALLQKAKECLK